VTVLVDTGALVADHNTRDRRHEPATEALGAALTGTWGKALITDYVVDEAVTLCRVRTGRHDVGDGLAARLLGVGPQETVFALARVTYEDFLHA